MDKLLYAMVALLNDSNPKKHRSFSPDESRMFILLELE